MSCYNTNEQDQWLGSQHGTARIRAALTGKHDTLVRRAPGWQGAPDGQQAKKNSCYKMFILHNKRFDMTSWFGFTEYIFCSERDIHLFIFFTYLDWGPGMVKCVGPTRCLMRPWPAFDTRPCATAQLLLSAIAWYRLIHPATEQGLF